jgi:hypothetical protein
MLGSVQILVVFAIIRSERLSNAGHLVAIVESQFESPLPNRAMLALKPAFEVHEARAQAASSFREMVARIADFKATVDFAQGREFAAVENPVLQRLGDLRRAFRSLDRLAAWMLLAIVGAAALKLG